MIRRGGIALLLFVGMVALAVGLWRVTPGSLVPDEDQGFYIAAVILPDGASLQRTDKVVGEVIEHHQVQPEQPGRDRLHRLRLPGRRLPQQRGDHLRHAEALGRAQGAGAGAGRRAVQEDRAHQGGAGAGLQPAADLRPGQRRRLRVLHPEPRRRRRQAAGRGDAEVPGRGQPEQAARPGADAVARRRRRSCTSTSTASAPRRWACRSTSVFDTLAATLGSYYVNDFNKFGRTWQVLMSAEPGLPQAARRHRPHVGALGHRADGAGVGDRHGATTRRARRRWTASTTCRRSSCSARRRRA